MQLFQASHQWRSRPDDERFTLLIDMADHFERIRAESRQMVSTTRRIEARPAGEDNAGMELVVDKIDEPVNPTHHAFGQLAQLAKAPAYYLRTLPSPIAADCFNYGLRFKRDIDDVGLLTHHNGSHTLRAATGPNYGRIWNADVVGQLAKRFGDGVTGRWKVPGEFGRDVEITKANTTLYARDRDMFCFLADEKNRIEVPNRRGGRPGLLARGFSSGTVRSAIARSASAPSSSTMPAATGSCGAPRNTRKSASATRRRRRTGSCPRCSRRWRRCRTRPPPTSPMQSRRRAPGS
jgi:hypothetical protein